MMTSHSLRRSPLYLRFALLLALLLWLVVGLGPAVAVQAADIDVACDTAALIAAIHAANGNGQANTLNLAAGCTYFLTAVDNNADGPNGLPSIASEIAINGNGAMIARSDVGGTPEFRILHVDHPSGDVTLNDLTVRNGNLSADPGGGIYSLGAVLTLIDSTITGNRASNSGGIANVWGRLTMVRSTVSDNQAQGSGGASRTPWDI